jgi:hypothetical protein
VAVALAVVVVATAASQSSLCVVSRRPLPKIGAGKKCKNKNKNKNKTKTNQVVRCSAVRCEWRSCVRFTAQLAKVGSERGKADREALDGRFSAIFPYEETQIN